jgi:hypothetical protein
MAWKNLLDWKRALVSAMRRRRESVAKICCRFGVGRALASTLGPLRCARVVWTGPTKAWAQRLAGPGCPNLSTGSADIAEVATVLGGAEIAGIAAAPVSRAKVAAGADLGAMVTAIRFGASSRAAASGASGSKGQISLRAPLQRSLDDGLEGLG